MLFLESTLFYDPSWAQDLCSSNRPILFPYTELPISSGLHLTWPSPPGSPQGNGARGLYRGLRGGVRGRPARPGQGNEVVGSTLTFEVSSSRL